MTAMYGLNPGRFAPSNLRKSKRTPAYHYSTWNRIEFNKLLSCIPNVWFRDRNCFSAYKSSHNSGTVGSHNMIIDTSVVKVNTKQLTTCSSV